MIDIIKRGSDKKFIIVCTDCVSTFTYEMHDTFEDELCNIYRVVRCPICGEELEASFEEYEELNAVFECEGSIYNGYN